MDPDVFTRGCGSAQTGNRERVLITDEDGITRGGAGRLRGGIGNEIGSTGEGERPAHIGESAAWRCDRRETDNSEKSRG